MTDDQIDEIQRKAMEGTMTEEEYDALTAAAIANGERLLSTPGAIETLLPDVFVPPPVFVPARRAPRKRTRTATDDDRSYGPAGRPPKAPWRS